MSKATRKALLGRLWAKMSPLSRLFLGLFLILFIGYINFTPKLFFGIVIDWPYAPFWGAVGWASAGLSIRVMLILILLGIFQDFFSNAPIGVFAVVNLVAYAVAARLGQAFAVEASRSVTILVSAASMASGFILLWIISSAASLERLPPGGFIQNGVITFITFLFVRKLYRLGGLPGERRMTQS